MTETIKLSDLQPDQHNANKGTERGRALLEKSLHQYGAGRSILLDKHGRIIAGNKTAATAGEIGIDDVIVVRTKGDKLVAVLREDLDLSDEAARMLAYADNRISQVDLEWDAEALLADMTAGLPLDDFWFEDELNDIFADVPGYDNGTGEPSGAEPQVNKAEELRELWGIEPGQLWRLPSRTPGQEHRLICGDCTDTAVVERVMRGEKAECLFFDPEWDNMGQPPNLRPALVFTDGNRAGDSIGLFGVPSWIFVWDCVTSWYTPNRPLKRGKLCLWYGDVTRYNFDGAHYGEPGIPKAVTNTRGSYHYEPDTRGKHLSDVFQYQITAAHSENIHPHSKPIDWVRMLIGNCTTGILYDPYVGSGVSVIACEQLGRESRSVEVKPENVAVALQWYADFTGQRPEIYE